MTFKIEKNVPLSGKRAAAIIYPFASMEVGDSFAAPRDMGKTNGGTDRRAMAIAAGARGYIKNHAPTAKFATRIVDENTVRCWRIA